MSTAQKSIDTANIAAQAALELNATDIVAIDVSESSPFADIFLIVTANSDRNAKAMADAVQDALVEQGIKMRGREGRELGEWILQNFGDVVVHIFLAETREFYALERVWAQSDRIILDSVAEFV